MAIPIIQQLRVGYYIFKQKLLRKKKYPLVLMLEPLFRCNLACAGCGKIDYPQEILNQRLSVKECVDSVEECGAPIVSIPGGEPLIHKEMPEIVDELVKRKKFVYLCTNALLMEKRMEDYKPSPYFTWSVHLDGLKKEHDEAVCQEGVFDRCISAIKKAKSLGFRCNVNCTIFDHADSENTKKFLDFVSTELKVDGITISPGFAYERAPDQQHFIKRSNTKKFFRKIFRSENFKKWDFSHSGLYLDFLAGNQSYKCTPWGNPTRNIFGWQKPCYLLGEGYVKSFNELMETTEWDKYGTGNYEKCSDCMAHCGYEASAVSDVFANPLKAARVAFSGPRTEGQMAKEIDLSSSRDPDFVFDTHVTNMMKELHSENSNS
ncbi:MAG: hopanoid biosynthesis associated radical SAM protein HpnH [Rickettsiales bacterium]|nr:hopanoid biosynthesis associated radical SAM protein HpnH [Rickettsiales bacterium]|tara:strand:- start:530 stop:1657 length:1128 start_codon:yes stop_codon:yes gene_type:complete